MSTTNRDWQYDAGPSAPTPPILRKLATHDFDEIAASLRRWESRFTQVDGGRFDGQIRFADLAYMQLFDVRLNRRILARGGHPTDEFVFSPVDAANADATWRGRSLRPGMVNVRSPGEEMDHRTGAAYDTTSLVIHGDYLRQCTRDYLGIELDDLLPRGGVLDAPSARTAQLIARIRASLNRLASPAHERVVDVGAPLVVELLDLLSAGRDVKFVRVTAVRRKQLVRRAEALVTENPGILISPIDLCSMTGVSRRTLEYAFREVTGLPPLAYLKALRLNMVRRELQSRASNRGVVGSTAARWGFFRSDHFAADYRRHFGEPPSASVGRNLRGNP